MDKASEKNLVTALVFMVGQYLGGLDDGLLDSLAMQAGEAALEVLAAYGLVEIIPAGRLIGRWTSEGSAIWNGPRLENG